MLAALAMLAVDGYTRTRWGLGTREQIDATAPVVAWTGALVGAVLGAAVGGWRVLRRSPLLGAALLAALFVGFAGRAASFGGPLRTTLFAKALPFVIGGLAGAGALVWALAARGARWWRRALVAALSGAAGVAALLFDGRVLVGTHRPLHDALAAVSFLLFFGAFGVLCLERRGLGGRLASLAGAAAAIAVTWHASRLSATAASSPVLRHLLHEPSALGAFVTRLASIEAATPRSDASARARWVVGEEESVEAGAAATDLRRACADCNIVVYFVDTLRSDVARDPEVMPSFARFAERSALFTNAYSAASDTLQSLPAMLRGRYGDAEGPSILERAQDARVETGLFISTSARIYLEAQLPQFRFDKTVSIADHESPESVWGYGADTPTGPEITARALEWMHDRRSSRFFAWIYNFDLHAWRDLREDQLDPRPPEDLEFLDRYRAVARTVDRNFARLLEGLDDLGLSERTIVLFVSDHGEALGYRGFITHSAFLWQPLVRVPLAIRAPGIAPRAVERSVSLVDVAPTLARFIDPTKELGAYHGVDLLRFYADPSTKRSLPILLRASAEGRPTYLGVIADRHKLVVAAGGGPAQLHDLSNDDPDEHDMALADPERASRLLDDLASSPLVAAAE